MFAILARKAKLRQAIAFCTDKPAEAPGPVWPQVTHASAAGMLPTPQKLAQPVFWILGNGVVTTGDRSRFTGVARRIPVDQIEQVLTASGQGDQLANSIWVLLLALVPWACGKLGRMQPRVCCLEHVPAEWIQENVSAILSNTASERPRFLFSGFDSRRCRRLALCCAD